MRSGLRLAPLFVAAIACGGEPPPPQALPPPTVASAPSVAAPPAPEESKPRFENPGGMWMPHQIKDHAAKLKELGLAIDPGDLSDPTSGVLSAIVSLGGCSASFVSPDGLVATNHHCATGALQHNSTSTQNLTKEGYVAKTRADEKNNGPQARVFVTRTMTDVTAKMRDGIEKVADDRARYQELEKRRKEMVASCEKGKPSIGCSVTPFYERAQYFLIEQLEIRDVRLVWAPPLGVGNFGGETDNWRWPRHAGDVSFVRAYVGKDGQPADYAPDNVPYKPQHWLKVASSPLREGDLVFVAGYPGRTDSLKTKAEVDEAISTTYPRRQKFFEEYLARVAEATQGDKEAEIRATSYVRRYDNALTNTKGQLDGLVKGGLAQEKAKADKALRDFVAADKERQAKWGKALDDIATEVTKHAAFAEKAAQLDEVVSANLVAAAVKIVRLAEERPKADAAREPEYQARNWPRIRQALAALSTSYNRKVDEAILGLALERAARSPQAERTPAFALAMGKSKDTSPDAIKKVVTALYQATTLGDEKTRDELVQKATTASLNASKDPLIRLALALRPLQKENEDREERFGGKMAILKPKYIDALRAFKKEPFAPDANGTLRVTYGTVRGYRPSPDAPMYRPFTVLSEVVAKNKGTEPFDVPAPLIEAFKAKRFGPYVDDKLGEVPVDFLADLHITGGNSGSAALNAKGELTGLVFDKNYEAMAADWVFQPAVTRAVNVDIRYVEWLLDGPFGGHEVLKELGVTPRL